MISEYEYAVNRDRMFKNSKYIIVVSVEQAETNDSEDWAGRINSMRNLL